MIMLLHLDCLGVREEKSLGWKKGIYTYTKRTHILRAYDHPLHLLLPYAPSCTIVTAITQNHCHDHCFMFNMVNTDIIFNIAVIMILALGIPVLLITSVKGITNTIIINYTVIIISNHRQNAMLSPLYCHSLSQMPGQHGHHHRSLLDTVTFIVKVPYRSLISLIPAFITKAKTEQKTIMITTVGGRNSAPPGMYKTL